MLDVYVLLNKRGYCHDWLIATAELNDSYHIQEALYSIKQKVNGSSHKVGILKD